MISSFINIAQISANAQYGDIWFVRGWTGALALALIVASIVVSYLLYRRCTGVSRGARIGLGLLRVFAIILIILIFLQPSISVPETEETRRNLLVLVDSSLSMGISDARKNDYQIAEAALAAGELPFDTAPAQVELVKAAQSMRQAQQSLNSGNRESAIQQQEEAQSSINAAVKSLTELEKPLSDGNKGTVATQLGRLAERQSTLREKVADITASGGSWPQLAERQGEIAAEVKALGKRIILSPTGLSTRQREQLAMVSRLDMVKQLLTASQRETFERLSKNHQLHYYTFAEKLEKTNQNGSDALTEIKKLEPHGDSTKLAAAMEQAVAEHTEPVDGLVILTDGGNSSGNSVETARRLGELGIPIYPIHVGLTEPDDVSIESVIVQEVAFEGDTVPMHVQIRSRGYENRQTFLSAYLNGRRVARESIMLTGRPQFEDLFFDIKGVSENTAELNIEIDAFNDEATEENNSVSRQLSLVDEKINVLYIEGSARWEYRYLRAILMRDPRLNVKFISTRADRELARSSRSYLARFPEDRKEAFNFDLVILGDVNPEFFEGEELNRLEELVRERGGSLLMLAGRGHAPVDYGDTPIETMLPVNFDHGAEWNKIDDEVHPVVTPAGRHSMVMTLADSARENDMVWARVKELRQVPPIIDAKPGAVVLAELSDLGPRGNRTPMIAWQRHGTGKAMFIGTDRLWRLRYKTGDKYHWRLWSQTIQFLTLSRLLGENNRIVLDTDRSVYGKNERVRIFAHIVDEGFEPLLSPAYTVHVKNTDDENAKAQKITLNLDANRNGLFSGGFTPAEEGRYQILADSDDREVANTAEFQVSDLQQELKQIGVQQKNLDRMAEVSGGQHLSIGQIPVIPVLFDKQRVETISYTRSISLWDTWPVLLAIILLLSTEWFLRRRLDMA